MTCISPADRTDWKSYILPLMFFKRIVDEIDDIVRQIRFPDWQSTEGGKREVRKALRRTLAKYKLRAGDLAGFFEEVEFIGHGYILYAGEGGREQKAGWRVVRVRDQDRLYNRYNQGMTAYAKNYLPVADSCRVSRTMGLRSATKWYPAKNGKGWRSFFIKDEGGRMKDVALQLHLSSQ